MSLMTVGSSKKLSDIQAQLQARLLAGEWKEGERLPTDLELASEFGCSVGTLGKALALLVHDGVLDRKPKAGTTVLRSPATPRPSSVDLDAFAFIYPSDRHEGIGRMVHGFEEAAREKGRRLVMLPTGVDFKAEAEIIARLEEFDVRGAVACPVIATPQDQLNASSLILSSRIPVVLTGMNLPGFSSAAVLLDNFEAGYAMTRHLLGQGIKKIGFLSNHSWIHFMRERHAGYRRAMKEAGVEIGANWVHLAQAMHADLNEPTQEPTNIAESYLAASPDVDAVVCTDDFMAVGLLKAAAQHGIKVPADLKVTGIDDFTLAGSSNPPLTTYRVPYGLMGRKAFELLESIVLHNKGLGEEIQLCGELVSRRTG